MHVNISLQYSTVDTITKLFKICIYYFIIIIKCYTYWIFLHTLYFTSNAIQKCTKILNILVLVK